MEQMEIQKIDFLIESKTKSESRSEISVRNFKVMVDEPAPLGGTDLAPNPVEYILCGLSGCIHILAFKIAREMELELKDLNIEIKGELNPEKLFGMPTSDRAGYQNIEIVLKPVLDATEEQKTKWLETMQERSPVLDNLLNPTPVSIAIA
jgi:uncharacterized OsmC-like protein